MASGKQMEKDEDSETEEPKEAGKRKADTDCKN
jgi:hypothetical protein